MPLKTECATYTLRAIINMVSKHLSPAKEQSIRGVCVRELSEEACMCAYAPVKEYSYSHPVLGEAEYFTGARDGAE